MLDILLDAGLDSVKMLPFLYLAYLLIEWIERTRGSRIEALLAEGSRWGAAVGALLGTIPQCGFSAMAASLYGSGVITLGTLMAVFIATSDEAIPMLLAVPERWPELAILILIKLCIALAVGLLLDLVVTRLLPAPLRGGFTGKAAAVDCHEEHEEEQGIWMAALTHTLQIFVYIFLFSAGIGILIALVGEEQFAGFLQQTGPFQPVIASLVGLIPGCFSSVLLTELYLSGTLRFSSALAGLCSATGVGLVTLLRHQPEPAPDPAGTPAALGHRRGLRTAAGHSGDLTPSVTQSPTFPFKKPILGTTQTAVPHRPENPADPVFLNGGTHYE